MAIILSNLCKNIMIWLYKYKIVFVGFTEANFIYYYLRKF